MVSCLAYSEKSLAIRWDKNSSLFGLTLSMESYRILHTSIFSSTASFPQVSKVGKMAITEVAP